MTQARETPDHTGDGSGGATDRDDANPQHDMAHLPGMLGWGRSG